MECHGYMHNFRHTYQTSCYALFTSLIFGTVMGHSHSHMGHMGSVLPFPHFWHRSSIHMLAIQNTGCPLVEQPIPTITTSVELENQTVFGLMLIWKTATISQQIISLIPALMEKSNRVWNLPTSPNTSPALAWTLLLQSESKSAFARPLLTSYQVLPQLKPAMSGNLLSSLKLKYDRDCCVLCGCHMLPW